MVDGLELRLDVDQQTGEPAQLVLADGESMLQLAVFAAPRSSRDLGRGPRRDRRIAERRRRPRRGGRRTARHRAGRPTSRPASPGALAPARFIGVDRPRWFLRGLLSGPAAIDREAAGRLEFAFRGTIVVRGKDAMPSRDPLPLKLPPEAVAGGRAGARQRRPAKAAPTLEQLEPGPTITETR